MPRCKIDVEASSTFRKLLKSHGRKYPKLKDDLADALVEIEKDHETAAQANAIPGWNRTVWKYRWKSSDLQKGTSGGIRLIAFYEEDTETLFPMYFYLKSNKTDISKDEISKIVKELNDDLKAED